MSASYSVSHLSDGVLLQNLNSLVAKDRATTAVMLAHLAEVDERKLFAPAGYDSMFAYCLGKLHFSEDVTSKRIHAARAARKFPQLLQAIADGRLHLSGVAMLAPKLTPESAEELIKAATHKSLREIEKLLVCHFPKPDVESRIRKVPERPSEAVEEHAARHVETSVGEPVARQKESPVVEHAARHVEAPPSERRGRLTPLAPRRFAVQATVGDKGHEVVRRAQELLSHQIPSGDLGLVIEFVFTEFVERRENQKFGSTSRPRQARTKPSKNPRNIPRAVRRAVRERDGDRCTYESPNGKRCDGRKFLEFDHILEIARGGASTVENLRLVCRTHNQHAAEQTYGAGFMHMKREAARGAPLAMNG